jgi:hypothetical protein
VEAPPESVKDPGEPDAPAESEPVSGETRKVRAPYRRWRRFARTLGEIAIVTAGILIAFALDAWWDNRVTAEREQIHLRALVSDFEQNVAALRELARMEEDVMSGSRELLKLARAPEPPATASLMALMNRVFNSRRYEPVMGAYEALVNSGGLMLIRDESLRAALAEFAARVEGEYAERWSDEHYFAFARDFGASYLLHTWEGKPSAADERAFEDMLRSPRFQEHLAMRYYSERDMVREYRALLERAESVLKQLREQLRT